MIKFYINKKKGTTTAVIKDSEFDAVNVATARLGIRNLVTDSVSDVVNQQVIKAFELKSLLMPAINRATVQVRPGDTYDEAMGENKARCKVDKNYRNSFHKAFVRWQFIMLKKIYNTNPETFTEANEKMQAFLSKKEQ